MTTLISRTVLPTKTVSVEYAITKYGQSFGEVMEAMKNWGTKHRNKIIYNVK
ncbi:MAG: winged helix-turn-helix transcriptional regulator [Chitinophagaceae bacterium]